MRFRIALLVAAVLVIAVPTSAQAHQFRSFFGPPLKTPPAQLAGALNCPQSLHHLKKDPVLLVPGTGLTGPDTYSWNYAITLPAAGYAYCIVTLPSFALGEIPTATEYVVFAIRAMAFASGRHVDVIGFSQGGLENRWALRFWHDTRFLVDDYVSISTPQHGTTTTDPLCAPPSPGCNPAIWQQAIGSNFLTALNKRHEIFPGPSYTALFTRNDDVVQPQTDPSPSSALAPRFFVASSTIPVQSVCPNADQNPISPHIASLADATFSALVMDALSHPGPAKANRIGHGVCSLTVAPGLDPATVNTNVGIALGTAFTNIFATPTVPAEPALPAYATH
jgi:Lipase (class 2)